jgi:hypothetical protein
VFRHRAIVSPVRAVMIAPLSVVMAMNRCPVQMGAAPELHFQIQAEITGVSLHCTEMSIEETHDDPVHLLRLRQVRINEERMPHAVPDAQFSLDTGVCER